MLVPADTHICISFLPSPTRLRPLDLSVVPNQAYKPLLSLAEGDSPRYLPAPNRAMALPDSQRYLCHSELSSSKCASISYREKGKG